MFPKCAKPGPSLHERLLRKIPGRVLVLNHTLEQRVNQPSVVIYQPQTSCYVKLNITGGLMIRTPSSPILFSFHYSRALYTVAISTDAT